MAKSSMTVKISIEGVHAYLRAFRDLPKDASAEIRESSLKLSKELVEAARAAGFAEGSQAGLVATTVRAAKDRVPVVVAGGTKRLGSNKKPAFKLLFGSEFGSDQFKQFKPHVGKGSIWFHKQIEENSVEIAAEWKKAADEIIRKFNE